MSTEFLGDGVKDGFLSKAGGRGEADGGWQASRNENKDAVVIAEAIGLWHWKNESTQSYVKLINDYDAIITCQDVTDWMCVDFYFIRSVLGLVSCGSSIHENQV